MNKGKNLRSVGVHDGTFHADEVTACALLLLFDLVDKDKIVRTRDPERLAKCEFVCDVGGIYHPERKLFDHHQVEYQGDLSSAGMILKYLNYKDIITEAQYKFYNQSFVIGVDAIDNGKVKPVMGFASFSQVISNFTPIEYNSTSEEENKAFHKALDFVYFYLQQLKKRYLYHLDCRLVVEKKMQEHANDSCLVFEKSIAWLESFFELGGEQHPAQFVIMPSGKHWKLRGIPPSYEDRMSVRIPLPQEWAGLIDEDIKRISGISGAIFCHKGRFISVWETQEDAVQALEYTLNQMEKL